MIFDIVSSMEEFCLLTQALACSLKVIGYVSSTLLTVFGGDEHDTITGLSTIDSSRSTIL